MKKLLVILALCMVLSVVLVACKDNTNDPEETTPEVTTPEVTTPEETTPEETTPEATTPEETTPEATTPEETTPEETTPEETTEPEPDPADPVFFAGAADLAGIATAGAGIAGAEVVTEDGFEFARITVNSGDPQFTVGSNIGVVPQYLAFVYRTTAELDAEMFIGTSNGPNGTNDHVVLDWNNDGNWNLLVVDLANCSSTNITDGNVGYFRLDPFRGATEGALDLAYIGFYNTAEYAAIYFMDKLCVNTTDAAAGFISWSFDGFYLNDNLYFAEDGNAAGKLEAQDKIVPINYGTECYNIGFRGWTSFQQNVTAFGYYITGTTGNVVFGEFKQDRPDLEAAGIKNGCGFNITVPTYELPYGEHSVSIYAKLEDGTIVKLYEIVLNKINLTVDANTNFMVSIDFVNGKGPYNAETGDWATNYAGVGGVSTGKIDAAVDHKTNDKNGLLTFGGWCGVPGGVNRYVWSIDGVNWMEVVSGGKDGEPLEGYYNSLNTEEGMTSTKNGLFNSGAEITIDLSIFPAGAQGNVMIGAIPELNQNSVIVICELANVTVAPVVETVYYNGENGTFSVPANFETKFFVRGGAAGMTMTIANADKFTITATNFAGDPATLTAVDGKIVIEIPADWDSFELTIVNNNAEAAEVAISFEAPAIETSGLVMGENTVEVTVENYYCAGTDVTFTATEAGTYTFGGDAAFIWCVEKDEGFSTPWTVELAAGDTLTLNVGVDDVMAIEGGNGNVTIVLNITKA